MNPVESKIVIIGESGVGKTSISIRYVEDTFTDGKPPTVGATYFIKEIKLNDELTLKIQIWDTAGQEIFRSLIPMYYRGADAAIIVYDIANKASFESLPSWLSELKINTSSTSSSDLYIAIVGNKSDVLNRVVTEEEGRQFAREMECPFYEVSAKTGGGINKLFETVIEKIGETIATRGKTSKSSPANTEVFISNEKKTSGCC